MSKETSDPDELIPPQLINILNIPGIRINRELFLRKLFSKYPKEKIEKIIEEGPLSVLTIDEVDCIARGVVLRETEKSTAASFIAGLPSNIAVMAGTGTADVAQYFAFVIRMSQEIAYTFGKPSIFDENNEFITEGQRDFLLYLGAGLGVSVANAGIIFVSKGVAKTASAKFMATAVTKGFWYPLLKQIGKVIGIQVTKKASSQVISKAIPIVGGVVSGGLTFFTLRPIGLRLVKSLETSLTATDEQAMKARIFLEEEALKSANDTVKRHPEANDDTETIKI